MIFVNKKILNTPALESLATVLGLPISYEQHYGLLGLRLMTLYQAAEQDEGRKGACAMITEYLGDEGLTECNSMRPIEIVESVILKTSAGAALLSDLRQSWQFFERHSIQLSEKEDTRNDDFSKNEYQSMTLRQWLETLVSEYVDID